MADDIPDYMICAAQKIIDQLQELASGRDGNEQIAAVFELVWDIMATQDDFTTHLFALAKLADARLSSCSTL